METNPVTEFAELKSPIMSGIMGKKSRLILLLLLLLIPVAPSSGQVKNSYPHHLEILEDYDIDSQVEQIGHHSRVKR